MVPPDVLANDALEVPAPATLSLPDEPVVRIRPGRGWSALNLRDVWHYRELLFFLTWRDIKVRYRQTVLGALWAVIQPLSTMVVFTLFFGKLAGLSSDGVPYHLFAYAGLLPWMFFANAVTSSGNSLVGESRLISKVYFPRLIVPAAAVAAGLLDFFIAFAVLVVLMFGMPLSWSLLLLIPAILLLTLLAVGVGLWVAALNVKYKDIRYALPFLIQIWMFITPVIYPASLVPEPWRWALALNPLTGIVECFRYALFAGASDEIAFDPATLAASAVLTTAALVLGAQAFKRVEGRITDLI
jgi:lipopolysaccharide transport system permease protein